MRKAYVGMNPLDRLMRADSIKDMLCIIKPYLERDRYKMLKRAIKTHKDERGRRDCILRYAETLMKNN
ncbi:MAG: hypothetical protein IJ555_01945 [Ruminococcus sp.]|nr:hypothetical protein [Ruminococcus sp.]